MKLTAEMMLNENLMEPVTELNRTDIRSESLYSEALRFSNSITKEINESNKIFYRNILEGGDDISCIYEASNSFGETIKNIIDKVLEFFKKIFTKFITQINSIVKSDKYLIKHKKDFSKLDDTFEMNIYTFTNLDDPTFPKCEPYDTYQRITNDISFSTGTETIDSTYTLNRVNNVYDNIISDSSDWYDSFRGEVLGLETPVSTADFDKELFEKFRNNTSDTSNETIDLGLVLTCLDRFLNYDKSVKSVSDQKRKLEREYTTIKKEIKSLNMDDNTNAQTLMNDIFSDTVDASKINSYKDKDKIISILTAINKNRVSRIEGMCNIHSLAFAKKLDAIKAAYKQDKRILYAALKKINKAKHESYLILDTDTSVISESYDYAMFLNQQIQNQNDIVRYMSECVALESGDFSTIQAINESAIDTIKAIIEKIIDSIKGLFNKFITGMRTALTTDKTFLAENKKIILNKPFKDRDITVSAYDTGHLNSYKVPTFDANKFDAVMKDPTVKTFITEHRTDLNNMEPADIEIKETILEKLCPDADEINMQSLNKNEIYRFCVGYEDTLKVLENDQNTIAKNQGAMSTQLARVKRELENEEAEKKDTANSTPTDDTNKNKEEKTEVESVVYSNVYKKYITELKMGKVNEPNKPGVTNTGSTAKSVVGSQAKDLGTTNATKVGDMAKSSINSNDSEKSKSDLADQYKEGSNLYFMSCGQILTAKMEACSKMYKDYMAILKQHVKDYAGTESANTSGAAEADIKPGKFTDENQNEHNISYIEGKKVMEKHGTLQFSDIAVKDQYADKLNRYISFCSDEVKNNKNAQSVFKLDNDLVAFNTEKNAWFYVNKIENKPKRNK